MAQKKFIYDVADALISAASDEKRIEAVMEGLDLLSEVFKSHPSLAIDLSETAVPLATRQKALTHVLSEKVDPFVTHALLVLQSKNLLENFFAFRDAVIKTASAHGHHEIAVISALPLTKDEREDVMGLVKKKVKGSIRLRETVDASIYGGLIIRTADWEIDQSSKGNIQRLNQALYV